jgi:hypothetical protein
VTANGLIASVEQFLTHRPYQAVFLIVHPHIDRLQTAVNELQQRYRWPAIAVSEILAQPLYNVAPNQRPRQSARLFTGTLQQYAPGPLLCHDIDLLFHPSLRLDPLRLLHDAGRQSVVVVAWPGTSDSNTLAYAVPEHAHYRTWPRSDLCSYCVYTL